MADKTINSQYSVLTLVNGEWPTKSFYATEQQQSLGCVWRCVSLSSNPSNRGFNALVLKLLFDLYNDDHDQSDVVYLWLEWGLVGRLAGGEGGICEGRSRATLQQKQQQQHGQKSDRDTALHRMGLII